MANLPISGLTASASNAAATDVLPVVQTTGTGPVKMTVQQMAGGLLGSTTLSGATITADAPVLNMSQTWNNGAVTFTGLKFNAAGTSDANSASGSLLMDLQVGTASQFSVSKTGALQLKSGGSLQAYLQGRAGTAFTVYSSGGVGMLDAQLAGTTIRNVGFYAFGSGSDASAGGDTFLSRRAAANLRLGAADAAAPVAQTLSVQSITGTNASAAAYPFKITGAQGTGNAAGGSIIFQVAPAGGSGAVQNTPVDALTIDGATRGTVFHPGAFQSGGISFTGSTANFYSRSPGVLDFAAGNTLLLEINGSSSITMSSDVAFRWASTAGSTGASGAADLILARDAANTLALRNGTHAQLFRVYSTYNGTNDAYGAIGAAVNLDGTAGDANTLYIGSQKKGSPTALTKLAIQVDGTTRLDYNVSNANQWFIGGAVVQLNTLWAAVDLRAGSGSSIYWNARSQMKSPADGDLKISNLAETDFGRLMFGGTSNAFPALKRVSANLQVIAADGTSSAGLIVGNQALATAATDGFLYVPTCAGTPTGTPTAQTGTVPIVVDTTNHKLYFYSNATWQNAGP